MNLHIVTHFGYLTSTYLELDEFVIMPNHLHGIIIIESSEVAGEALANQDFSQQQNLSSQCFAPTVYTGETIKINGTKPQSLTAITQNYKSVSTRQINRMNKAKGNVIWQRNYYEHIIRNEEALNNIREYIVNNPINWVKDQENPANFQTMQLLSNKNLIRFI